MLTKIGSASGSAGLQPEALLRLLAGIVPFSTAHAEAVARLYSTTRSAGFSLGDRACIALAIELGADVYTADHAWTKVKLPCRVHLIR